jgi:hypothetical protein
MYVQLARLKKILLRRLASLYFRMPVIEIISIGTDLALHSTSQWPLQWSQGCFQPSNAGPSCFARYINCRCVSATPYSRHILTHEEPHACTKGGGGKSVQRSYWVDVDRVSARGCSGCWACHCAGRCCRCSVNGCISIYLGRTHCSGAIAGARRVVVWKVRSCSFAGGSRRPLLIACLGDPRLLCVRRRLHLMRPARQHPNTQ